MAKRPKFDWDLIDMILKGTKTSTWRINDEKALQEGDQLSLCDNDGKEFAKAVVTSAKDTAFGRLTGEDKKGHEAFRDDAEMYAKYSAYYKFKVAPETALRLVRFRLVR